MIFSYISEPGKKAKINKSSAILDKIFGTKKRNTVKLDKTSKM